MRDSKFRGDLSSPIREIQSSPIQSLGFLSSPIHGNHLRSSHHPNSMVPRIQANQMRLKILQCLVDEKVKVKGQYCKNKKWKLIFVWTKCYDNMQLVYMCNIMYTGIYHSYGWEKLKHMRDDDGGAFNRWEVARREIHFILRMTAARSRMWRHLWLHLLDNHTLVFHINLVDDIPSPILCI